MEIDGGIRMANKVDIIDTNYFILKAKGKKLEEIVNGSNGIIKSGTVLRNKMDELSKSWDGADHYEALNAFNKEYAILVEYTNILKKYAEALKNIGDEYEKAVKENVATASDAQK